MKILRFIWGLPQNIIGSIMYLIISRKNKTQIYNNTYVCEFPNKYGSVSLGMFIFVDNISDIKTIKHEYGHCRQSNYLGWLYLIIIGLPSIIWASFFDVYRIRHNKSYYDFYTERWANKLGGI